MHYKSSSHISQEEIHSRFENLFNKIDKNYDTLFRLTVWENHQALVKMILNEALTFQKGMCEKN